MSAKPPLLSWSRLTPPIISRILIPTRNSITPSERSSSRTTVKRSWTQQSTKPSLKAMSFSQILRAYLWMIMGKGRINKLHKATRLRLFHRRQLSKNHRAFSNLETRLSKAWFSAHPKYSLRRCPHFYLRCKLSVSTILLRIEIMNNRNTRIPR